MRRGPRGGPGDVAARLARAESLLAEEEGAAREPLAVLCAVLRHQLARSTDGEAIRAGSLTYEAIRAGPRPVLPRNAKSRPTLPQEGGITPLCASAVGPDDLLGELTPTLDALASAVPQPLADAAADLRTAPADDLAALADAWLEEPAAVDPRLGFWLHVAAAPVLEATAVAADVPSDWHGGACPVCGAQPQASVIVEESGEFMAGSPRSLVCGRCASWWPFPRVTCAACGEEDPRSLDSFMVEERRWARVDTCSTCRGYVKTFDLRQPGARDVVPLVDDVATLTLDVWAQQRGFHRATVSPTGV